MCISALTAAAAETPPFLTNAFEISHTAARRGGKMIEKCISFHIDKGVRLLWHQDGRSIKAFFSYLRKTVMEQHDDWHLADHV